MKMKEIRKEKGIHAKEIANLLGVSQTQISRIESGFSKLNSEQIIKICNFLNVSSDELLGLKTFEEQARDIKKKYKTSLTEEEIVKTKEVLEATQKYIQSLISKE